MVLTSPEPASLMWQWISVRGEFNSALPLDTLTVELALGGENTTTTVAYFDDLCLRFSQPCKTMHYAMQQNKNGVSDSLL